MAEDNVIRLASVLHDGMLWTPEQMLKDAIERVQKEFPSLTKAMVIFYDTTGERIAHSQCGMTLTEMVRMLSRVHDEAVFDLIEANL